ncbi:MAG: putative DCC family thiol-disulfide oxidoreductase YuxK [Saprospiraceae bacterium]|mgnify:CR=1 FL=1|jgi:predicted DCC family thiol-disulfide oxidoreductase YuxK
MKKWTKSELILLSQTHPIIAFDGVCNLCDGFIQWLIKRDCKKLFRYVTLQSELGKMLISASEKEMETVVLVYKGIIYTYSDVGLLSMKILGGSWKVLSYLSIFPKGFRDMIYHFISRNRYSCFGKKDECMVPTAEVKGLFL